MKAPEYAADPEDEIDSLTRSLVQTAVTKAATLAKADGEPGRDAPTPARPWR
jgi:hypothetical protein